jgi:hypothetical protein
MAPRANKTRKVKAGSIGKGKTYETHDNGGRPFFVTVSGKNVVVMRNMNTYKRVNGKFVDVEAPPKEVLNLTADEIFIGKKSPSGGYDGLKPSEAEGNSILVKQGGKYIFIGHEIFEFSPVKGDRIESFYSDIGNSDVPYPYAVGKTHMYILLDKVAIQLDFFSAMKNIYEQYYYAENVLDMCLRGYGDTTICKDKEAAKREIAALNEKTEKLKVKILQKRK